MKWRAVALLGVGLLAMVGDLAGLDELYALGMASHASPAPRVFTERAGLEGFSAGFLLEWDEEDGAHSLELTPAVYARMEGPYNRRNVYGAALAGGPFLSGHEQLGALHAAVVEYAFCETDVLAELGANASSKDGIRLVVSPRTGTETDLPLHLEISC